MGLTLDYPVGPGKSEGSLQEGNRRIIVREEDVRMEAEV